MKKLILKLVLVLSLLPSMAFATSEVTGILNNSSSGTASATVVVPTSSEYTQISDLTWRLDSGVTTGLITIRSGDALYNVNSATSGSGSVVWFSNTGTAVAVGEYIIVFDESAANYMLRQVTAATTTSVTVSESISVALTTNDRVWSVVGSYSRPVPNTNSATTATPVNIWLPRNVPTALTVEGNTTACRISISGNRSNYK